MPSHGLHLVPKVPNLRAAEEFSRDLFDLDVLFREGETADGEYDEKGDAVFVTDRYGVEWELNAWSPPPETPFETLGM